MIKKYNKEVGFIYKNENNIDKIYKNNQLVFEQGFIREDSGVPPLTTSHLTTGKNLKGYKIYGNSRQNNLPDGYQEVEWIKAVGIINLGIKTNNNMQFEAKYLRTNTNTQYVYYSDTGSSSSTNTTAYASGNGVWRFGSKATAIPQSVNTIYETIQNKNGVWVNGEKIGSYTSVPTFTSSNNLRTFGTISGGSTPSVQLYYLKTKDYGANTYSHIWIPCKRTLDNLYGLYDIVGNEFYTNSEATITAGDDVEPSPNYPIPIESVGDLVTDSTDTNYGKYKITVSDGTNSTTTNIYLDEPLRKIGNYADYIDFENQKAIRKIGKFILKGNEVWDYMLDNTHPEFYSYIGGSYNLGSIICYCTHFIGKTRNQLYAGQSGIACAGNYVRVTQDVTDVFNNDVTTFKNWLSTQYNNSTPVEIEYIRATELEESITLPTIPSIKGTTIYSVGTKVQPSNMYIKYKGR